MVDLDRQRPTAAEFVRAIQREMKIRFYQQRSIKSYRKCLEAFLRWCGRPPHQITKEHVRCYLEVMVDGGAGSSWVGNNLSAIRTAFDKMCGRSITLGLQTPRRPKRVPVILSSKEVIRLLESAPKLLDRLLLGLMYAAGLRVSEVVRLRFRDVDFDRRLITVWQGKGRTDRQVMLPESFEPVLRGLAAAYEGNDYLFPGVRNGRHMSPRTAQRVMQRAVAISGIRKRATCHSLRHSFASHMLANGTDIRHIQKLLGHARLETTTLYAKVTVIPKRAATSPLDVIEQHHKQQRQRPNRPSVGKLRMEFSPAGDVRAAKIKLVILTEPRAVCLDGLVAREARPGWVTLDVPPLEAWEQQMRWLNPTQRERIESADFFRMLQEQIPIRYQAWRSG